MRLNRSQFHSILYEESTHAFFSTCAAWKTTQGFSLNKKYGESCKNVAEKLLGEGNWGGGFRGREREKLSWIFSENSDIFWWGGKF